MHRNKMLLSIILVLGVWHGVVGTDDICNTSLWEACSRFKLNADMCSSLDHLDCQNDYFDKCGYRTHDPLPKEKYDESVDFLRYLCRKKNFLFKDATSDIRMDDICNTPGYRACSRSEIADFSETEEDFDRIFALYYIECLKDYADKCGYEYAKFLPPFPEEKYQTMKNLLEEVCQKDSQLHGIQLSISCIIGIKDSAPMKCNEYKQNKSAELRKYTQNKKTEGNYDQSDHDVELWTPINCVTDSLYVACLASETSKRCGSDTQRALMQRALMQIAIENKRKVSCPSVEWKRINELISILKLEKGEERLLKEFINKKELRNFCPFFLSISKTV